MGAALGGPERAPHTFVPDSPAGLRAAETTVFMLRFPPSAAAGSLELKRGFLPSVPHRAAGSRSASHRLVSGLPGMLGLRGATWEGPQLRSQLSGLEGCGFARSSCLPPCGAVGVATPYGCCWVHPTGGHISGPWDPVVIRASTGPMPELMPPPKSCLSRLWVADLEGDPGWKCTGRGLPVSPPLWTGQAS